MFTSFAGFLFENRWKTLLAILLVLVIGTGWYQQVKPLPPGLSFNGWPHQVWDVKFHGDLTTRTGLDEKHMDQEIFDEIMHMISQARQFILLDKFLFNDYTGAGGTPHRQLSKELTDALISQKKQFPELKIIFITDPVNEVYGGLPEAHLEQMRGAGIQVVLTKLEKLRDSNPIYSSFWRPFLALFGNGKGTLLPNPLGRGRVSIRSYLRLLNFKANHRKVIVCDQPDGYRALITSANPHDASSSHDNVALSFSGPAVWDVVQAEYAVMRFSGAVPPRFSGTIPKRPSDLKLRWVTEKSILNAVLAQINSLQQGEAMDMMMFYLSHRDVTAAILEAHQRGAEIRILLDPNKDAFGRKKNGIPNRQVAHKFHQAGIAVRWADTKGEQCHSKLFIFRQKHRDTLILGSANMTRRNLDNYNLEANVVLSGSSDQPIFSQANTYFNRAWLNENQALKSVTYDVYADESLKNRVLYFFMEGLGLSTF